VLESLDKTPLVHYNKAMIDMANKLNSVLASFKIDAKCLAARRHRHLAVYDVCLSPGCRVRTLEDYSREIALSLKCKGGLLVVPVSEEGIVRIKVAERDAEVLDFEALEKAAGPPPPPAGVLPLLLGETDAGDFLWSKMEKNPHILVAGETGSGKSTLLHAMIANVIKREDVWLHLIDPKHGLEFGDYENAVYSVAYNYDSALNMLRDVEFLMNSRSQFLSMAGYRSIEENPAVLPKILLVVDELASLMLWDQDKKNPNKGRFETLLIAIAQRSRAAGIYIIAATQRPSIDVVTGLIKANFPARIACRVSSAVDSKVILDQSGAESLLGCGDAIINSPEHNFVRFQVGYATPESNMRNAE